jgi:hypothetical protein
MSQIFLPSIPSSAHPTVQGRLFATTTAVRTLGAVAAEAANAAMERVLALLESVPSLAAYVPGSPTPRAR